MRHSCTGCGKRFANDATGGGWIFIRERGIVVCAECKQSDRFGELVRDAARRAEIEGSTKVIA